MIFAIIILLFLGAIAFFHYIQGFFSATISAIITVFSAVIAFSYHESVAPLLGKNVADYASAMSLLALFGITYLIIRVAFDRAVIGNIRLPFLADKVGSVVMGLIAGIFGAGIVAIAGQELPFGPDVGGYTRYEVQPTRKVSVSKQGKAFYTAHWDELSSSTPGSMGDAPHGVPIIPVDDIVVNTVAKLSSETGSLSRGKPLTELHPDFLTELFGQRLGIEPSAARVAFNLPSAPSVKVLQLFSLDPKIAQGEAEVNPRYGGPLKPLVLTPNEMFLVIRFSVSKEAGDSDNFVRFSPGSSRLLVHDPQAQPGDDYQNYFPVGAMFGSDKLLLDKPDDYLFARTGTDIDLVYKVPKKLFEKQAAEGAMFEFKRGTRIGLAGMTVDPKITDDDSAGMLRKQYVEHPDQNPDTQTPAAVPNLPNPALTTPKPSKTSGGAAATPASTETPAAAPTGTPFGVTAVTASKKLPVPFGVAANPDATALMQLPENGNIKLQDEQLKTVVVDAAVAQLIGPRRVTEFSVPSGMVMIQVEATADPKAIWGFTTDPEQYEIVDNKQTHYAPNGLLASYKGAAGDHLLMRYIDQTTISGSDAPKVTEAPTKIVLFYNVPAGSTIVEFDDHGQKGKSISVVAK